MANGDQFTVLEVRLTVVAGYCGIFPEPELIVWLRAASRRPGKVLVVQPVEPIDSADEGPRTYRAEEHSVCSERVRALVGMLTPLGFPDHAGDIEDTSDPASIWWAGIVLEVTLDGVCGRLEFGLGPDGVRGCDAERVQEILRALLECVTVPSPWSDVLSGP